MSTRLGRDVAVLVVVVLAFSLTMGAGADAAEVETWVEPAGRGLTADEDPVRLGPGETVGAPNGVQLLSSTGTGVTFEVDVPWERLSLEPAMVGGKAYVRVSLPGWETMDQPGAPALPFVSQLLGVPVGADVSVRVELGRAHTMELAASPLPAATQRVEGGPPGVREEASALPEASFVVEEDPTVYWGAAAYPGALAEVSGDGMVRQQRVVAVKAHPLQYYPKSNQLIIYESLRIEITFEGRSLAVAEPSAAGQGAPESAAYESVFRQQLLNYETARAWRSTALTSNRASEERGLGVEGAQTVRSPLEPGGGEGAPLPWAPPDPGWRIKVREDGFYRLTYDELAAAGLPVDTLDPQTLQLYHRGSEVAIEVEGEGDGTFDETDYVVFFGEAVASKYTGDNVYWLTHGGGNGLRMGSRDGTPGTGETPDHYAAQQRWEENGHYLAGAPGDENLDRWFWDYAYPPERPSWSYTFSLPAPSAEPATLTVGLLGYLDHSIRPDHHVEMYLNGELVGDAWWDGITWRIEEMAIPAGLLAAGDNTLELVCPNDTGVGVDVVYVDWMALEFANGFVAENGELAFRFEEAGTWAFQVEGFGTGQLAVYDVSDRAAAVRFEGVEIVGPGPYSVLFEDEVAAASDYWALAEEAYGTVAAIEPDTASDLRSTSNGADYVVISADGFLDQAERLEDLRASQGLRAAAVDVQDVYDEFGYGIEGAAPIRAFLAYAYSTWQAPAPSYVVLMGDGHYDPNNYQYSKMSHLPPYLAPVDPWFGEVAADNRYVAVVGEDLLPDMMLGRLAVNSSAEAAALVDKIVGYEEAPPEGWQEEVLVVADDADSGGGFAAMSEELLACCVPEAYSVEKVYYGVTHTTVSAARAAIKTGINAGKLIVNYLGHAGVNGWAEEGLFLAADVQHLQNGGKLPVMLPMTCWDGYYIYPHAGSSRDATAEVVTRAQGKGAVASWSPTGLGVATGHGYLNRGFFRAVFQDGVGTVGEATTAGKLNLWASGRNLELLDTYLLFGDPALQLPVEVEGQADLYVEKTGPEEVSPGETITYTIAWGNSAGVAATGAVVTDTLPAGVSYVGDDSGWARSEPEEGVIVWTVAPDPMPAGASGSFVVTATVGSEVEGSLVNEVRIAGTMSDANPADNEDQWVTAVRSGWRVYLPVVVRNR